MELKNADRINALHRELVPYSGKAGSLAGELVRAVCHIGYRLLNDGDMAGRGYGRETCNPATRFIACNTPEDIGDHADYLRIVSDSRYKETLDTLTGLIADYIEANPWTRTFPAEDMWDYRNPAEDVDEEDEYYEEEDY